MKRIVLILLMVTTTSIAHAQLVQYSLYRFAEPRTNPANLGLMNYAAFSALYQSQQSQPDVQLNSAYLHASYPFLRRKGTWSALGVEVSNNREGIAGIFITNQIGVQYGLHIPVSKTQQLAFGVSVNYVSRQVNTSELFTGSQFVSGQGFDRNINQGEGLMDFNADYYTVGLGTKWQQVDKHKGVKTYGGLSLFNVNRPLEDFISNDHQLPINWVVEGGQRLLCRKYASFYLEGLLWQVQSRTNLNTGLVTQLDLRKFDNRLRGQTLKLYTKYLLHQGAMLGWQWENSYLSLGMSYDLPLIDTPGHNGAIEFGLKVKKLVKAKRKRNRKKKKNTPRPVHSPRSKIDNENPDNEEREVIIIKRKEIEKPEIKLDSVSLLPPELPIESKDKFVVNFNFEYAVTTPIVEDEYLFERVLKKLKENPNLKVKVIGHTDDVGSANFNQKLSELRANAVADILLQLGDERNRIIVIGKGESEPLVPNNSDRNRSKNRRVEFIFFED